MGTEDHKSYEARYAKREEHVARFTGTVDLATAPSGACVEDLRSGHWCGVSFSMEVDEHEVPEFMMILAAPADSLLVRGMVGQSSGPVNPDALFMHSMGVTGLYRMEFSELVSLFRTYLAYRLAQG